MSARSNPFEELERLFDRMSRQFDQASTWWGTEPTEWSSEFESMAVDILDTDEELIATVDLPGFERDDIEVRVTDHTLRIDAEREERVDEAEVDYVRRERRQQSAHRSITLPEEVDPDAVDATMKNGVLTITMPKLEIEEARTIEIE